MYFDAVVVEVEKYLLIFRLASAILCVPFTRSVIFIHFLFHLDLISWMSEGPRKEDIADEDQFCDQQIIKSIMKSKEVFDQLEGSVPNVVFLQAHEFSGE